jgi:hypothetical protein
VKSVIDFGRIQPFGVKRQHLRRRQIFRIKVSFPFRVLKTGSANPRVHLQKFEIRISKPETKPIDEARNPKIEQLKTLSAQKVRY